MAVFAFLLQKMTPKFQICMSLRTILEKKNSGIFISLVENDFLGAANVVHISKYGAFMAKESA